MFKKIIRKLGRILKLSKKEDQEDPTQATEDNAEPVPAKINNNMCDSPHSKKKSRSKPATPQSKTNLSKQSVKRSKEKKSGPGPTESRPNLSKQSVKRNKAKKDENTDTTGKSKEQISRTSSVTKSALEETMSKEKFKRSRKDHNETDVEVGSSKLSVEQKTSKRSKSRDVSRETSAEPGTQRRKTPKSKLSRSRDGFNVPKPDESKTKENLQNFRKALSSEQYSRVKAERAKALAEAQERDEESKNSSKKKNEESPSAKEKIGNFFTEVSQRARKTFRFISRPISEAALKKWANKVLERKQRAPPQRELPEGEDAFPKLAVHGSELDVNPNKSPTKKSNDQIDRVFADNKESKSKTDVVKEQKSNSPHEYGHTNGGNVLVNGKPFWKVKDKEDKEEEDKTEDDLPMNADVVLDVHRGKIKLATMPSVPITLDPFGNLDKIKDKDDLFFSRKVLFGNTVRTMINATEFATTPSQSSESSVQGERKAENKESADGRRRKTIDIKEPKSIRRYSTDLKDINLEKYINSKEKDSSGRAIPVRKKDKHKDPPLE